jgi:hypothetical protein
MFGRVWTRETRSDLGVRKRTSVEATQASPAAAYTPLSPRRAFVVQFRTDAGNASGHFAGRIEHMTSGQAARFSSPEELVAFMTRVLTQVPAEPPQKP